MPYAEIPRYYRGAELFVFPSYLETFGHPLLEAMASDLPLVASDIPVFREIAGEAAEGSTCWFGLWSPGKFYAASNDFSYNISPKAFRDIFLPTIERQTNFLDHTVYHVDGVNAFVHVDALCELPRL